MKTIIRIFKRLQILSVRTMLCSLSNLFAIAFTELVVSAERKQTPELRIIIYHNSTIVLSNNFETLLQSTRFLSENKYILLIYFLTFRVSRTTFNFSRTSIADFDVESLICYCSIKVSWNRHTLEAFFENSTIFCCADISAHFGCY